MVYDKLWYRNPSTNSIEFKEDFDKAGTYSRYVKNQFGGVELKEFASDAALGLLRIADPVLTSLVQGYVNADMIGDKIFTPVKMAKESGKFPAFGQEVFTIPTNLKRSIGGRVARLVSQSGSVQMSLSEYAEGVSLDNRERNEWAGSPELLLNSKLNIVSGRIALLREKNQAVLATTSGGYGTGLATSGAALKWATDGDPVIDMRNRILDVQKNIGTRPNVVWFSPASWELFINNEQVLKRIRYGGSPITPAQMSQAAAAELLQVKSCYVGYAVFGQGGKASEGGVGQDALTMGYLWDSVQSSNAGCAVVGSGGGIEPAFGYTWERANSPIVESYYENQTKSQVWDYEHFFDAAITLTTAGGLLYSVA